jgi:hypothetical protein
MKRLAVTFIIFFFSAPFIRAQIIRHGLEFGYAGNFEEIPAIQIKDPGGISFRYHFIMEEMGLGNVEVQAGAQFFSLGTHDHDIQNPINREKKFTLVDLNLSYAVNLINPDYNAFQIIAGYAPGLYLYRDKYYFDDHIVAGISGGTYKYRLNFMYHFALQEQFIGTRYDRLTNTTTSFYFKPNYITVTFMILSGW